MSDRPPAIELRGISKRFGTVEVLSDVGFSLRAGEVHSLAGENGAGKSTVVKILAGIHRPDSGQIFRNGVETTILGPTDAQRQGIAVVHQHPALFPDLSVAENIFVGRQPKRGGRVDWVAMTGMSRKLLERLRVELDVRLPVKMLTIAERQSVEIARALSFEAQILVLDEPTSAISGRELDRLHGIVEQLKSQGVAILFISHFIDEILGWADEVTILRSGKHVATRTTASLTPEETVRLMIGAPPDSFFPKEEAEIGETVLSVRGLSGAVIVEDVNFDLRAGEILGFFGLVGAGRTEVAEMLFGIRKPDRGEIRKSGQIVAPQSPGEAMKSGISLLPEDRHQQGLVLKFPIRANQTLPILRRLAKALGIVDTGRENTIAEDFFRRVKVVATGVEQETGTLSGGNQQKVLLAKWLIPEPRILILDQPTRGIDVGAKAEIHRIISHLAAQGIAIILIGDDAEEVMAMSDRMLVFRGGRIADEFDRPSFDREAILLAAAHGGQRAQSPKSAQLA
jgi:rhamnose transport system ATP-binding protein